MIFGLAILATALLLSAVAAYYSVAGLVAIFSAAVIPVIIMGGSLELGKIAATVWLHNNWRRAGWAFKLYLVPAVAFLMLLTSMGIFGYLSKAHSDQSLVSGDSQAKIAIYDEKIRTARENIDANRRALRQLDEAVDQVLGRSTTETGAERSVQIRRQQAPERQRLLREIEAEQKKISALNEERAPIAAEVRKVEAEVGPIKYIAALLYGDNPDANLLERAVRWMIIMIVLVFDPLALALILAANKQFAWARQGKGGWDHDDVRYPPDNGPLTDHQIDQIKHHAASNKLSYLFQGNFWKKPQGWQSVGPMVAKSTPEPDLSVYDNERLVSNFDKTLDISKDDDSEDSPEIKAAKTAWKEAHPHDTLKHQRTLLAQGKIKKLPWLELLADNDQPRQTQSGFGTRFPGSANKGDTFVRVDVMPSVVYKFNGSDWIVIDKNTTDSYTYDTAYIDHLITLMSMGQYDPDLLSEGERQQVQQRLETKPL